MSKIKWVNFGDENVKQESCQCFLHHRRNQIANLIGEDGNTYHKHDEKASTIGWYTKTCLINISLMKCPLI
jgi:hypothetical protein